MADLNVALKAVLLKFVGLDKLEECFQSVMFMIDVTLRAEIREKILKMTDEQLNKLGYFKKEEENAV